MATTASSLATAAWLPRAAGLDEVPVIELAHLSPSQKRAYVISDNRLALDAGWNEGLLALELAELSDAGYDLTLTGFEDAEIAALLADDARAEEVAENKTPMNRTPQTTCRMHLCRRHPAPAMSGPSARIA